MRDMLARARLQNDVRVRPSIRFKSTHTHGKLPPSTLKERNMALIECYECKRSISSQAAACIHCGAPMAALGWVMVLASGLGAAEPLT